MKILSLVVSALLLSGCALIEACHATPSACTGGSEVIRVNGETYKIDRDIL